MVIVHLNGRLGNQLFQYAFALAISKRLNTFYIVDDKDVADSVKKYFYPISIFDNDILRRAIKKIFKNKSILIEQNGFEELDGFELLEKNNSYYKGYFQSVKYMYDILPSVKNIFKLKYEYKVDFFAKYSPLLKEKLLIIHYRVGDYVLWGNELLGGNNMVLPVSYYKNALKMIKKLDSYNIIIVTDDAEVARTNFDFIKEKKLISGSEINDFQLLMHADKLIISNSTFAWWAAFLNIKSAEVFAPRFWLGFKVHQEYPRNILPPNFISVPVN